MITSVLKLLFKLFLPVILMELDITILYFSVLPDDARRNSVHRISVRIKSWDSFILRKSIFFHMIHSQVIMGILGREFIIKLVWGDYDGVREFAEGPGIFFDMRWNLDGKLNIIWESQYF
jgi:hypothetical protein